MHGWLSFIELMLASASCRKATASCSVSMFWSYLCATVRSSHCPLPPPVSHSPPSLYLRDCYLSKMADRKSLMPSDVQCSSCLVYRTDSHLSWAYINNYTVPVSLIIGASAQRYVFCCCQETGGKEWAQIFLLFLSSHGLDSTLFWSNWQADTVRIC